MKTVLAITMAVLLTGSNILAATHPGFLLNQQEINQLKVLVQQPGYVQDCWLAVKSMADNTVASGALYTDFRDHPYDNIRHGNPISALGMAYAITEDVKYANHGAKVLRAMRDQGGMGETPGPVDGSGFSGNMNSWIFTLPFLYDMIYNSSALTASDKASIEAWFKGLVSLSYAHTVWANPSGQMPGWESWMTYRRMWRNYLPPECANPPMFVAAIGYLLEDPVLIKWGTDGNNYPLTGYNRHAVEPATNQNPYSIKHHFHDAVCPMGENLRLMKREGSFNYGVQQIMGLQIAMEAAWHRGVDLWRYRDPESDGNMQSIMDYFARYVRCHRYYFVDGVEDARWLWELPYSHYRDDLSKTVITWAGPLVEGKSEQRPDYSPRAFFNAGEDLFGRVMPMIAAIDRSTPNVDGVNLGPILLPAAEYSSTATVYFEVAATPWQVKPGDPISVTIRAVRRADGTTATDFVSDSVRVWTNNWSPGYADYTGGKPYSSAYSGGGYAGFVYPPTIALWDMNLEPDIPNPIRFTTADQGVKTITVRLKQGGVGVSYRLEAIEKFSAGYPYKDLTNSALVRGWSNRIFVGIANVGIERRPTAEGTHTPTDLRISYYAGGRQIHFDLWDGGTIEGRKGKLFVYGANGRLVQQFAVEGQDKIVWNTPQGQAPGVYIGRLLLDGKSRVKAFVLAK